MTKKRHHDGIGLRPTEVPQKKQRLQDNEHSRQGLNEQHASPDAKSQHVSSARTKQESERVNVNVAIHDLVGAAAKPEVSPFQKSLNFPLLSKPLPGFPDPVQFFGSSRKPPTSPKHNGHLFALPQLPIIHDKSLADVPFTHAGVLGGATSDVNASYDRLEFLGDAYIELIATRLIYPRFPLLPAGRLSQKREMLVKNETLAEFSVAYGFDKRAHLPQSYLALAQDKSKLWIKTMGDVFEAYIAAIILSDPESGFAIAEAWLTELWIPKLSSQDNIIEWDSNPKVQLSTRVMGKGFKIQYRDEAPPDMIKKEGKILFSIGAYFTGWGWENTHLGSGKGLNKNEAGSQAAAQALLNPLTAQIEAVKREFDAKTAAEREKQRSNTTDSEPL